MKPVILVLDDDPDILAEVCETLAEEDLATLTASDGAELWALTEENKIDLFIRDLVLPGESGLDLAKAIRRQSDVGIIIVTG